MKKQVAMFVWNTFTNDARVLRECTALVEAGYEVELFCLTDGKLPKQEWNEAGFKVVRINRAPIGSAFLKKFSRRKRILLATLGLAVLLPFPPLLILGVGTAVSMKSRFVRYALYNSFGIIRMTRQAMKKEYDIYHANDLNTLPQAVIASSGKPVIYDSHEVQTDRTGYGPAQGILERLLLRHVTETMVENDTRAAYHEHRYGVLPRVLHNYPFYQAEVPVARPLRLELGLPADEAILLYQGGIQEGRGLEKLIEAMPFIEKGTLVFIGDGKIKQKLIRMAKEQGTGRIHFIDKVPLADLPGYTAAATVGFQVLQNICFNHYSASSNKLFEYMAAGVPVVAADLPEIRRVVEKEGTGIVVDAENPKAIADAVNEIVKDERLRLTMKQNALKARDVYHWDAEKKYLLACYASAVEKGRGN
ncbi:glycosyltransferase [Exiguobacterium flavidum]|uniref:glycosyltransferase n=1 Tax=Exiguobacterium flavidum TaxID=2184695 RepID=UPI001E3977DC|nr:glycosyltransferase [Exiguobacterium flavidum]